MLPSKQGTYQRFRVLLHVRKVPNLDLTVSVVPIRWTAEGEIERNRETERERERKREKERGPGRKRERQKERERERKRERNREKPRATGRKREKQRETEKESVCHRSLYLSLVRRKWGPDRRTSCGALLPFRCREKTARIRQSRPDSGFGVQVKVLKNN